MATEPLEPEQERALAVDLYNRVWELLEDITSAQHEDEVVHCAHASVSEAMARAYAPAGDRDQARLWRDRAVAALDAVEDPAVVEDDLAALPDLG